MNELSLFTGGGVLGTKLLGFNHIGYVEINEYCQQVIRARIEDGIFDEAPIFTDVREFIQSGAARQYRGFVDVVTAGFPCQGHSLSGNRHGENDERNMWPETIEVIRQVKPERVLLENVPGLLSSGCGEMDNETDRSVGYFGTILADLAESGFNVKWCVLSAADVGAEHVRERVWIFAYTNSTQQQGGGVPSRIRKEHEDTCYTRWGKDKPGVDRALNGVANQSQRLEAIGNGQVPLCVATAWRILTDS